ETLEDFVEQGLELQESFDVEDELRDEVGGTVTFKGYQRHVAGFRRKLEQTVPDLIDDLVLIDRKSNTVVSHRDVGIGISQVLPVLVTAYAAKQEMIAIEQPEIHLHPALQSDLGDVLIESALGERGNRLLIETHSEHIILRIMRRMRETAKKK